MSTDQTNPPSPPASEATAGDRECALQVMRAVRDLDAATRNLDIVEGLRLAHAAGDIIAAHVAAATAKERQARQLAEGENARLREDGISRFPGFSLRESPIRVQRLGFAWLDQKGLHRRFEMAITDNHPLMVANQLKELAEGIEEAHWDPKSPLARLAPAPAGGKP